MNNKILNLLGVVGVTVGMTTVTTAAQASDLGPGRTDLRVNAGVLFTNNIVDFLEDGGVKGLGTPGDGVTTTLSSSSPLSTAGIFGIIPNNNNPLFPDKDIPPTPPNPQNTPEPAAELLAKLGERTFIDAPVKFNDIGVGLPGFPGATVTQMGPGITMVAFDPGDDFLFLEFDTDRDGNFGSADDGTSNGIDTAGEFDFEYFATKFTRTVTEAAGGGFNVSFDIEGFFRDYKTVNGGEGFKDTPSIISLFNGATDVDPNTLPFLNQAQYDALPGETDGQIAFLAGADGVITTVSSRDVPEPGVMMGLTALAGLGLGTRLKRKAK